MMRRGMKSLSLTANIGNHVRFFDVRDDQGTGGEQPE